MSAIGPRRATALLMLVAVALIVLGAAAAVHRSGYRMYVVHTGSMSPTLRPGDLVIDTAPGTPRPGTIVTFLVRQGGDSAVTHRVVGGTSANLVTKGDANASADPWQVPASDVVGRVAHRVRYLGFVAVFLRQPAALGSMFTGILSVVLLWSAFFGTGTRQRPRRDRAQRAPLYTA